MKIGGITDSSAVQPGNLPGQKADAETKRIQSQIKEVQKQIQKLAENDEMSAEEKMKKKQELNKKISDLNNQLRQHQMEVRREKQQEENTMEKMLGGRPEEETKATGRAGADKTPVGMSESGMKAMISAGYAMDQAAVYESTADSLDGRARVLKVEIELDSGRGRSVKAKEDELASVQQKAGQAQTEQVKTLGEAGKNMQAAEGTSQTPDEKKTSESSTDKTEEEEKAEKEEQENTAHEEQLRQERAAYKAIDILL